MKLTISFMFTLAFLAGCQSPPRVADPTESVPEPEDIVQVTVLPRLSQSERLAELLANSNPPTSEPSSDSIIIPSAWGNHFRDREVKPEDVIVILETYHVVPMETWMHNYSHVAGEDRTGTLVLKDGREIEWVVRPGGLAWLRFPGGGMIFLAAETHR